MMMHTTLAQLRTLKLDSLATGLEEQLAHFCSGLFIP